MAHRGPAWELRTEYPMSLEGSSGMATVRSWSRTTRAGFDGAIREVPVVLCKGHSSNGAFAFPGIPGPRRNHLGWAILTAWIQQSAKL